MYTDTHIHLSGDSFAVCYRYPDQAPILRLAVPGDGGLSITLPSLDRVTPAEVAAVRLFAAAVEHFHAEVERMAAAHAAPQVA